MSTPPITTWDNLNKTYDHLFSTGKRWLFRGQRDAGLPLKPSLERALHRFGLPFNKLRSGEDFLLRQFKRNFHRYSLYMPSDHDKAEWLALMQHHGVPTRLLDWTYSFHIALFFAIEFARVDSTCGVWAVDNDFLVEILKIELRDKFSKEENDLYDEGGDKDHRILNKLFDGEADIVLPMNPLRLNERLAIQQGIFLFSQSKTQPFHKTFELMRIKNPDAFQKLEIVCSQKFLLTALRMLQSINIWRVSLFPGLDGFCQSFENQLPMQNLRSYLK
ncbi:MAG: FRG domain-containing protein [Nitrososphaera sp.]|nr:FRG domain-containing protein [Nitrososphaera sp.]